MKYVSRCTRCEGRSSSFPSSAPMLNSPAGTRANCGTSSSGIRSAKRKYTAPHESGTVRDGADAVHVGEPGGLQPVGKRRLSADAARAPGRRYRGGARSAPRLHAVERHARAAVARRGALSGRVSRARRGHQRRLGGQLTSSSGGWSNRATKSPCWCPTTCRRGGWSGPLAPRCASGGWSKTRAAGRWRPDLDQLRQIVSDRTRLIIICTPNNPTGARITAG